MHERPDSYDDWQLITLIVITLGALLFFTGLQYGGHRRKGHTAICASRQAILDVLFDFTQPEPYPASVGQMQVTPRSGETFNSTPLLAYSVRLLVQELFCVAIGLLAVLLLVGADEPTGWQWTVIAIGALAFGLVPLVVVARKRPYVVVDENGLDIVVNDFFRKKYAPWLFAWRGYGYDLLPMVIDYMGPTQLSWSDVRGFTVEKRYMLYRVYALTVHHRRVLLASRYRKRAAQQLRDTFRAYLPVPPKEAAASTTSHVLKGSGS